jgi:curli biogenesis system outer membrane secretion channel CsgG
MKKLGLFLIFLITLVWGCGYGMHYTKSIYPTPSMVTAINVMDVQDAQVTTRHGVVGSGKTEFIKNIFINELLQTKRFKITNDAEYALYVKIDDYKEGYRKYIALSSRIVNTKTNEIVWNSSISGLSKSYIDDVIKNTVKEMVAEMTK